MIHDHIRVIKETRARVKEFAMETNETGGALTSAKELKVGEDQNGGLTDPEARQIAAPDLPMGYDLVEAKEDAILHCAMICHEVTAAMNLAHHEYTIPWEINRGSIISGVMRYLDNPKETPEENHNAWMSYRASEGWTYGQIKDAKAKTHPCMVPYGALDPHQQSKDMIFRAIVRTYFGLE